MNFLPTLDRAMKKPPIFVILPIITFLILLVAKWQLHLPFEALYFFLGGILGIYLLDIAEEFFSVKPSPFWSIIFFAGLSIVTFYLIVSSREFAAKGLSLSLLLSLYMLYVLDWVQKKTVQPWFSMLIGVVPVEFEKVSVYILGVITIMLTILFVLV